MQILITGVAGFIGASLAQTLLDQGHSIVGVDNLNDYYDINLKKARLTKLQPYVKTKQFRFEKKDIVDRASMFRLFESNSFDVVVHLAAQAGVRHSIDNPQSYIDSNLVGFANVLEGCRQNKVAHLVYASSSSVYAGNDNFPFHESDRVDSPVSLYAATKKANELMAHSYNELYGFRCTGLRFFTVYGPWGRPDMAPFLFAERMLKEEAISVFNQGEMIRDFTYIDDVCDGVSRVVLSENSASHNKIYNIGRGEPVELMMFIEQLSKHLGVDAKLNFLPMQPGDVVGTMADTSELVKDFSYQPTISVDEGVKRFADWYKSYYKF